MNFSYGSFSLFSRLYASAGALQTSFDGYTLDFYVHFMANNPPRGALVIHGLELHVSYGGSKRDIGLARPEPANMFRGTIAISRQSNGQHERTGGFRLYLSREALENIEVARAAGDAVFHLRVLGIVTGFDAEIPEPQTKAPDAAWSGHVLISAPPSRIYAPEGGYQDIVLTIEQSKWVELLRKAGYMDSLLIEIPVPQGPEFERRAHHIRDAQFALAQGRYADVVARCRDALDSLLPDPACPWGEAANAERRKNMTVEDSFRLSWGSIRQITHSTHHRNNLKSEFTRSMAQYVLGATCLALSLGGHEKDLFMEKPEAT